MRRRHPPSQEAVAVPAPTQKDVDIKFTTKYIDTLNDLQRLEDENKRLMLRMRALEAQIVPASKSSQQTFIKMVAPSCLEYHQEERKLNKALQEENEMLRRQFQNSVNAAADANEKLTETLNKIKLLELEIVGKVDEARQGTQAQYSQEVKKMQENLVDLERRWGMEKKQLTMDRDSYALQCESLKVDAAAARAALTEATASKGTTKDEVSALKEKIEILERERNDLRMQLVDSEAARMNDKSQFAGGEDAQAEDMMNLLERASSRGSNVSAPDNRPSSATARHTTLRTSQQSPLPVRALPASSLPLPRSVVVNDPSAPSTSKLENDVAVLSAKNRELQKQADQHRVLAEGMEAQNETLALEVKRLSDKIRLLSTLDGRFSVRPESPPYLPNVRNSGSGGSSGASPSNSNPPSASNSRATTPAKATKRGSIRSVDVVVGDDSDKPLRSSRNITKDTSMPGTPTAAIASITFSATPPAVAVSWDTGPAVSGQKLSPKRVIRK